ncbi:MAG TPA: hypothetical protein VFP10_00935 [Candidatus Eisenbacteria bacterium]|nr:hypothetical protein [Candidatus Eisenbacteria bacterium]
MGRDLVSDDQPVEPRKVEIEDDRIDAGTVEQRDRREAVTSFKGVESSPSEAETQHPAEVFFILDDENRFSAGSSVPGSALHRATRLREEGPRWALGL